jgi:hypothetical protein
VQQDVPETRQSLVKIAHTLTRGATMERTEGQGLN